MSDQSSSTPMRAGPVARPGLLEGPQISQISPIKDSSRLTSSPDDSFADASLDSTHQHSNIVDVTNPSNVLALESDEDSEQDQSMKSVVKQDDVVDESVVDDSMVDSDGSACNSIPAYNRDKDRSRSLLESPASDSSPVLRQQNRRGGLREHLLYSRLQQQKRHSQAENNSPTNQSQTQTNNAASIITSDVDMSQPQFNESRKLIVIESSDSESEQPEIAIADNGRRRVIVDSSSDENDDDGKPAVAEPTVTDPKSATLNDEAEQMIEQFEDSQLLSDGEAGEKSEQSAAISGDTSDATSASASPSVDKSENTWASGKDKSSGITVDGSESDQSYEPSEDKEEKLGGGDNSSIIVIDEDDDAPPVLQPEQDRQAGKQLIGEQRVQLQTHTTKRPVDELIQKRRNLQAMVATGNIGQLPDGGVKLMERLRQVELDIKNYENDDLSAKSDQTVQPFGMFAANKADQPSASAAVPSKRNFDRMLGPGGEGRLFGGKMTETRWYEVRAKTEKTVAAIHASLKDRPADTEELADPIGLRLDLMRHQRQGLAWMGWRETHIPAGGILADDMGLGKTLSMISLILLQKQNEETNSENMEMFAKAAERQNLYKSRATLVVCPASVVDQWAAEIERRVKPNRLRVEKFTGPKNKRESNAKFLGRNDVVITTYGIVSTELGAVGGKASDDEDEESMNAIKNKKRGESVLGRIAWNRVILDEAHQIKNHKSKTARAICSLPAKARWCLSGTPIHNELLDFYSLVKFLRVSPFDELAVWKEMIGQLKSESQRKRLNVLSSSLLLRRTKDQKCTITEKPIVQLEGRKYEVHMIDLLEEEQKVYDKLFEFSRSKVKDFLKSRDEQDNEKVLVSSGQAKPEDFAYRNPFRSMRNTGPKDNFQATTEILVLLLRLRQACVHLCLTKEALDLDILFDDDAASKNKQGGLEEELANVSIVDDALNDEADNPMKYTALFEKDWPSTKISKLLDGVEEVGKVKNEDSSLEKCVIVSQWAALLNVVEEHLRQRNLKFTRISGDVPQQCRQERVDKFNKKNAGPTVMLLSLTAGGVGLNLIGGNHLFLLDLHWNPALEKQACDRIYRMGQTKDVYIHKYICKGTIEERVMELQERKLALATSVLKGAADKSLSKLTMKDFKFLFELDSKKVAPGAPAPAPFAQPPNPFSTYAHGGVMYPPGRVPPPYPPGRVAPPYPAGRVQPPYPAGGYNNYNK